MIYEEVSWRKGEANSNKRVNRISGRALKKRVVMGGRYFQIIVVFMKAYRKQENRRPTIERMNFASVVEERGWLERPHEEVIGGS